MSGLTVSLLTIIMGILLLCGVSEAQQSEAKSNLPSWIDNAQTYCMVPLLPERAAQLNATVNGIWGGMGGIYPILTHTETVPAIQEKYGSDEKAFVSAIHAAGQYAVATVNGLEGFEPLKAIIPEMESMACRDPKGNPLAVDNGKMMIMCVNNPDWVAWETEFGKKGIDNGADIVLLDTPMSASFVAGMIGGGFCEHCMAKFQKYLEAKFSPEVLKAQFGIEQFNRPDIIARLSGMQLSGNPMSRPFIDTSSDALLFREFIYCQDQAAFDTRKQLFDAWRQYAETTGRQVVFTTNAGNMGTVNPVGHWVRALMFADLVDIFVREQNYSPNGTGLHEMLPYPRGKWAAFHLLAYAIHHKRAPACVPAGTMGSLLDGVLDKDKFITTWMGVQSAEAYACNGAYIQYYIEPISDNSPLLQKFVKDSVIEKNLGIWKKSTEYSGFVKTHEDLYNGPLTSGSTTAFLFLMTERGRTIPAVFPSYLGLAQGLLEGGFSFDVLFAGDGHFVQDQLKKDDLNPYQTIVIPSPIQPTSNQQSLIKDFIAAGGTVVCQEPEQLGLSGEDTDKLPVECVNRVFQMGKGKAIVLTGNISPEWTGDVGSEFFRNYNNADRSTIIALGKALEMDRILQSEDGLVCAFPVIQPSKQRVIVHLVNYDIDYEHDTIRDKENITVNIKKNLLPDGVYTCSVLTPGTENIETLSVTASDNMLTTVVPRLGASAIAIFSMNDAKGAAS